MDADFLNHVLAQVELSQMDLADSRVLGVVEDPDCSAEAQTIVQMLARGCAPGEAISQAYAARWDAQQLSADARAQQSLVLTHELQTQQRLEVVRRMQPVLPRQRLDADALGLLLWQLDPMNTGCHMQEGMRYEYASIAAASIALREAGVVLADALDQVFGEMFWEGCLQESNRQPGVQKLLHTVAALETPAAAA